MHPRSFLALFCTAQVALLTGLTATANPLPQSPSPIATPQTVALFGIPKIPVPGGSVEGVIKGAASKQVVKALGETLQKEAPIASSAKDVFPTVAKLPGKAFNPNGNAQPVLQQLRTSKDGTVMLPPGDYAVPVDVFCMKASASSPNGHRYLLAPLKGKMADVITALNTRSIGSNVPHSQLQVLSWNLQAGMKYEEMSPEMRTLVDRFLSDFKPRLKRSYYEQVEATWKQVSSTVPGVPSLDSAIADMGEVGKTINTLRQTRAALISNSNNFDALSRLFVTSDASAKAGGAANTPWSQISDRVYGRMVTEGNYSTPGELQIRVIPGSSATAKVGITNLVADSQTPKIQPLSMSPIATPKAK
jgi:hypothetical protein